MEILSSGQSGTGIRAWVGKTSKDCSALRLTTVSPPYHPGLTGTKYSSSRAIPFDSLQSTSQHRDLRLQPSTAEPPSPYLAWSTAARPCGSSSPPTLAPTIKRRNIFTSASKPCRKPAMSALFFEPDCLSLLFFHGPDFARCFTVASSKDCLSKALLPTRRLPLREEEGAFVAAADLRAATDTNTRGR